MNLSVVFSLVAYFVLFLALIIGFLAGLKRGLVRSSMRLGTLVVCLIIAGLITMPISTAISNINISSLNWTIEGTVASTIPEGLKLLILSNEQVAAAANDMPSIVQIIEGLPAAIISIVVFFILVLVMLLVSYIIYVILEKFALRESRERRKLKKLEKQAKKDNEKKQDVPSSPAVPNPIKKKKKKIWLGAAVGTFCGFIFIFALMLPITSITSTISDIANSTVSVSAEETSSDEENVVESSQDLLRYYLGDEVISYIDGYSQSVAGKILTVGGLDDAIFDSITTIKVNNEKFCFRNDIYNAAKIYDDFVYIVDSIGKEGTYKNINFEKVDEIIDKLFETGLFKALAPELIPYAVNYVYDMESFKDFEYKDQAILIINGIVNNLDKAGTQYLKTLRSDFSSLIEIGKSACKVGLVDDLVGGKRDLPTLAKSLQAENYMLLNSITKNLIDSSSFKTVIANGTTAIFDVVENYLDNKVNLGEINSDLVNWENLEPEVNSLLKNVVDAYLILNEYDFDEISNNPKILVSSEFSTLDFESLINILGKELNLLKSSSLIKNQEINAYNEIVSYISTTEIGTKFLDEQVLKETNWESELKNLTPSIVALKESGALSYALTTDNFEIDSFLSLLAKENSNHETYAKQTAKPLLNSNLSIKPIKYLFEQFNNLVPNLKESIGDIKEIDLTNYNGLSENDKTQILNVIDALAVLSSKIGLEKFKNETFDTIFSLNNMSGSTTNSKYVTNLLVPLSKVEITKETYDSFFNAIDGNENFKAFVSLSEATSNSFDWESEFEKINMILTVLEKENSETSIRNLLFPSNKLEVNITSETLSKAFDILSLPLYELAPENSCMEILVVSLYESKLLKQSLVYLINTLDSLACEKLSTTEKTYSISEIELSNLTESQKLQIVNVFNSATSAFKILIKDEFNLETLSDDEIVLIGTFINALKENAYNYVNNSPSPLCTLSADKTTVINGGVFAPLYLTMIDYAKQTYSFSGDVSYGTIEWVNFLKTAKKLSELSGSSNNILDLISDKDSNLDVGDVLEIVGVESETTEKISSVQDSFSNLDSSNPDSFENLATNLGTIDSSDATKIENAIKETTGKDITGAVDVDVINKEKVVSSRISYLMKNTLTSENLEISLSELCNGAVVVLGQAVSSGVVLQFNLEGGASALKTQIENKTTSSEVQNLVKTLFGIN